MNDKGRLEHIKLQNQLFLKYEKAKEHQRADEYLLGLWQEHGCWIIEQLGRVQELEEQLKDRDSAISTGIHVSNLMRKQNERYRKALKEIKLGSEHEIIHYSTRVKSLNKIATKALEKSK